MYPKLFGIDWLDSYIVMAVLGFAAAFLVGMLRRKRYGYKYSDLISMLCASIIGLVIGAKLLFIITQIPALVTHGFAWEVVRTRVINGGFVFYGGLIGAFVFIYLLAKYMKYDAGKMLNFVVPCFTAFHALGRVGCLLEGCCYGKVAEHGITLAGETVKRVPVQLYEALSLVAITAALLLIEKYYLDKEKRYAAIPVYILMYAPVRFIIEIWRGDVLRGVFSTAFTYTTGDGKYDGTFEGAFDLSTSQIVSLLLLLGVAVYFIVKRAIKKHDAKKNVSPADDGKQENAK